MKSLFLAVLMMVFGLFMPVAQSNRAFVYNSSTSLVSERQEGDIAPDLSEEQELIATQSLSFTTFDTYMEAYFSGLTTNMGENYKNSCGYVALGMLLSYYDSYLDDNIIDETYDQISLGNGKNMIERNDSPGIYHDIITNGNNMSGLEYYNKISSMQSYSFHAKLMTIGKALGILDINDENNLGLTTNQERISILREYFALKGIKNYSIISATDRYSNPSDSEVKNFVKEYIDQGYPVLLSAKNTSGSHAMICYSYNGTNYYGNMGWTGSSNYAHYSISSRYPIFTNAMVLMFRNKEHSHAYNYQVNESGYSDKYCYCNSNIFTYTGSMTKFDEPVRFSGNYQIPYWITDIGIDVLKGNNKITAVSYELNSHLTRIEDGAFSACNNLVTVQLPKSLEKVGVNAFGLCNNLKTVTFEAGSNLREIQMNAFAECPNLSYVQIPSSVTKIGTGAFSYNDKLKSVTFSNNVEEIGQSAFSGGGLGSLGYITVYTESAGSKSGWDKYWNAVFDMDAVMNDQMNGTYDPNNKDKYYVKRPVFWGCTLSADKSYVVSFNKTSGSISNATAKNGISAPIRIGYSFGGWFKNSDFTGTSYSQRGIANAPDGIYYAKWKPKT